MANGATRDLPGGRGVSIAELFGSVGVYHLRGDGRGPDHESRV